SYWDPSGVALVMDSLVPGLLSNPSALPSPLLQSQLELQREHASQLEPISEKAAEDAIYRLFAPITTDPSTGFRTGVVGQWHALLPAVMHYPVGTVMASSAEPGISMAGKNPQRMRFFGATTAADWSRVPDDGELSAATISVG